MRDALRDEVVGKIRQISAKTGMPAAEVIERAAALMDDQPGPPTLTPTIACAVRPVVSNNGDGSRSIISGDGVRISLGRW